ncbi:hypothetical protein [Mesonia maritima]|uniref:Uncharacterized protein n=1 Tax=Mesonia maritima TaxID=1793873 RepID=A0ABU1K6J0_9FLAO|nr:hypothetical protein [Mesonia maritima]MDR6301216.1 hypothetical protein [Mesonia maritima]
MKRAIYIIGGMFLILFLLVIFFIYRYNLFYGETTFQKSVMLGCIQKTNKKINNTDAKKFANAMQIIYSITIPKKKFKII